ncbi:MAG: RagB/SusD family nutrient uptake outer membrane protein [Prevotella sp.]|nr:RagB/SusD family nutrient uptake outer membrane protein [Prevotella sp.]
MNRFIQKHISKSGVSFHVTLFTLLFTLSSCSDYLDVLPLNEVVLENYWTKKDDVTSELNGCYESLTSEGSLERMGIWGELRSENLVQGSNLENKYVEILKENILPTNDLTKWEDFYRTINRCNILLNYADGVQKLDPNYTEAQMRANKAEATFIRDLCYFYLIRTFRDVPMVFEPSIDDLQDYKVPATPMMEALKMLSDDLEKVKDDAVLRYVDDSKMTNSEASSQAYENCAKVTRVAIYTLLADIYLWRGEYDKAISCCDYVINFKKNQYKERVAKKGQMNDMFLFNGIPMIRESLANSKTCGNAFNEIFGYGNENGFSFESIFELGYKKGNEGNVKNNYIYKFYSGQNIIGGFAAPEDYYQNVTSGTNDYFAKNDCRVYENIIEHSGKYIIGKYTNYRPNLENDNVTDFKSLKYNPELITYNYHNWIIYRLSDVMLIKAEACIMKNDPDFQTAFSLINSINKRARNYTENVKSDSLAFSAYSSNKEEMEKLLMLERKREFMFEGKRWFDLVRKSLRDGNTNYLANEATKKQKENAVAIKIQFADINTIFWPYNREELKKNTLLKQNSAYSDTEDFQK